MRQVHQAKEEAYKNRNRILYMQAKNKLDKDIRAVKRSYSDKVKNQFSVNDPASVWRAHETSPITRDPPRPTVSKQTKTWTMTSTPSTTQGTTSQWSLFCAPPSLCDLQKTHTAAQKLTAVYS